MQVDKSLIEYTKKLLLLRYPSFASDIANTQIEYKSDLKYHTAATDGKNIYFDPNYLQSLPDDEKVFLIAHEIMHMKFNHMGRLIDKNGKKRDMDVWNDATDAIINANLQRDGFTIKDGYVNRPEALNYNAEDFYELLLKEKEDKNNSDISQKGSGDEDASPDESDFNRKDEHTLWEDSFTKKQTNKEPSNYDEKKAFSQNRIYRAQKTKEQLEKMKEKMLKDSQSKRNNIKVGTVGVSKEELNWKDLLRREIEKTEDVWSQRRSIAENNYAYRLEESDVQEEAETEVMIDVSGSVEIDLVKAFLRIIKPILRHSKLRVGCFNEKYWGMVEIKSEADIDNFVIPEEARGTSSWTEDWDLAVRSFSKRSEINKIVFTDGEPAPGNMPKEDLRGENIIWLVYGNESFNPCCGKVIQISEKQLEEMHTSVFVGIKK